MTMSGATVTLYCAICVANKTFHLCGGSHRHGGGGGPDVHQTDTYYCETCKFIRVYPPKQASDP